MNPPRANSRPARDNRKNEKYSGRASAESRCNSKEDVEVYVVPAELSELGFVAKLPLHRVGLAHGRPVLGGMDGSQKGQRECAASGSTDL